MDQLSKFKDNCRRRGITYREDVLHFADARGECPVVIVDHDYDGLYQNDESRAVMNTVTAMAKRLNLIAEHRGCNTATFVYAA